MTEAPLYRLTDEGSVLFAALKATEKKKSQKIWQNVEASYRIRP